MLGTEAVKPLRRLTPLERAALAVHALQPEPLPVVFIVPATDRARERHRKRLMMRHELHLERWEKFRRRIRVHFPDVAETTALYHVLEFWELWTCGIDPYHPHTFAFWRALHVDIRLKIIRMYRRDGRDPWLRWRRRRLLKTAMAL